MILLNGQRKRLVYIMNQILKIYNPLPDIKKSGAETFKVYVAVKAHFTAGYNIKKYKATVKQSNDAFLKRNDKFFFNKIAEKFTLSHNYMIFVHNFLENADKTVFDLMDQDAIEVYNKRNGNVLNAYNNYKRDVKYLFTYAKQYNITFKDLIVNDSIHPPILKMMMQGFITIETFMILDSFLNLLEIIESNIPDYDPLWPNASPKLKSYKKILEIDTNIAKSLFIEINKKCSTD